jgi:hypothetical protein
MEHVRVRRLLLEQHKKLSIVLARCRVLAGQLRDGAPVADVLEAAIAQLRTDLVEHSVFESTVIRALVREMVGRDTAVVDRILAEHLAEHVVFWELITGTTLEVAGRIDTLCDEIHAHMAAEERTYMSPIALHRRLGERV